MTNEQHDEHALYLLASLSASEPTGTQLNFVPNSTQSRNAAKAMTAVICHRLFLNSNHLPLQKRSVIEWQGGSFNCRNIADRNYLWTNLRRKVADEMHSLATERTLAFLLACSNPGDTQLFVWSIA